MTSGYHVFSWLPSSHPFIFVFLLQGHGGVEAVQCCLQHLDKSSNHKKKNNMYIHHKVGLNLPIYLIPQKHVFGLDKKTREPGHKENAPTLHRKASSGSDIYI